ncbi:MAG: thioesterase family protein [Candidatus Omnitrophota bacterium]|nr:acyl-CoA thioesterase [Candidatus Omnitrophota bacterium]MBU1929718.1 acyl-CoA thioesterase [Candidatus Omnitrophota bacterium]MBU2035116.1 acyl-CoA thioesterase [Candidatus Omnitrophota bacterium]MBU2221592.1 acyl-CoA thioesterase [Candidatus Omnitrophota bacterium]MBU2258809.1 acyl-CoA thioesterase [Candidatus Omnitrophota bacterium]
MKDCFIEKKIYYHDTDCGGVVYYANYLKFFEEGRAEYCLDKGVALKDLANRHTYFVVAHTEINYKAPARYQDKISISTGIEKIGNASINFIQKIARDDIVLVESKTTWVCVGKDFKPKPVPEEAIRALV